MSHDNDFLNSSAIAIIGFSFRFPGDHNDEKDFWNALKEGQNLIGKIPSERWATDELQHLKRSEPGRSITFSAGVLSKIDEFDANFFGISPREAAWIDPQQRLLLELAWEAMENAHAKPSSLAGSDCAVYVGISGLDYGTRGLDDLSSLTSHIMTGNTLSIAANRLSYVFDLHGPSLAIDTACSSSLVALHHACQALHTGEASTALVGGVNMLLHPYPFIGFTKASMLSADGLCKTFDASGNGYVRAEGGAVLLIKPLQKAIDDGDDIQAVILASGSNTDGSRKSGITIPSKEGQIELMKSVLAKTNLSVNDIDFIEAHGTGTSIGDPIETAAIGEVYGKNRHKPLPIGSIKANLGHMEPASGMAGLIKTILSLKNRALIPQIHLNTPNPHIDFSGLNIQPVTQYTLLSKEENKPLVAGVNSFGFGGANAHVLVQEYSTSRHEKQKEWTGVIPPLFLSARTDAALKAMATQYVLRLQDTTDSEYYDIAYEAAYRRDRMQKHLVVMAKTPHEVCEKLEMYSRGCNCQGIIFEEDLPQKGSIAFIYSGNGAQWIGMGLRLMAESTQFAKIMQQLDLAMQPVAGFSILNELEKHGETSQIDDTIIAQPLLFALQVALTKMLKEFGIQPSAVSGHSVGEVAAAWACGALDLDSAIKVIVARSTAQGTTRGTGRMAAVGLSAQAMQEQLNTFDKNVSIAIAGINSPNNITISGNLLDLNRIQSYLEPKGIFFRLLDLDYAFHSNHMDSIEEMLLKSLNGLKPLPTKGVSFISTVTGKQLSGELLDATYWWRNVREPVCFSEAITTLSTFGCRTFIEIAPHAILQRYISETLSDSNIQGRILSTLRKNNDGLDSLIEAIMRAHMLAETPRLESFFPIQGHRVTLPNYPWQRERHWHPKTTESLLSLERRRVHPLLGWRIPEADLSWENTIDPVMFPWLDDHKVGGAVVFPGAGYAEMALAAAKEWLGNAYLAIEDLDIVSPMVFDGEHARTLHLDVNARDGSFQIKSRQRLTSDEWSLHAVGRIIEINRLLRRLHIETPSKCAATIDRQNHYGMADILGLNYGPSFQGLKEALVYENCIEVTLEVPIDLNEEGYCIHPALLDVCYQSLIDFYHDAIKAGKGSALLPIRTSKMEVYSGGKIASFRARLNRQSARSVLVDFEIFDAQGDLVASLFGCRFRAAPLSHKKSEKVARWQTTPWLTPHPAECGSIEFPSLQHLFENAHTALEEIKPKRQQWFQEAFPLLEALVLSFVFEAFQKIELSDIIASKDPYVKWLIALLKREGILVEQEHHIAYLDESVLPHSKEIWQTILAEYPETLAQLTLLGRIGTRLPEVLNGELNRQKLYDSIKDAPVAEDMYNDDPVYLGIRFTLAHILKELSTQSAHRRLRVLEISSGATELPLELLGILPEDRLDYVLALPDQAMKDRQQIAYSKFNNLSIVTLTYDEWKFDSYDTMPETFDIIILHHTLHKVRDINTTLKQIKNRLTIGGCLFVAERYPDWSANLLFGLDTQWWHEEEAEESPYSSLLTPSVWEALLSNAGLETINSLTEPTADLIEGGSYLVAAKHLQKEIKTQQAIEAQSWLLLVDSASITFADQLTLRLKSSNQNVIIAYQLSPENVTEFHHVIYLQGWDTLPEASTGLLSSALTIVHILASLEKSPRLWLITRGGALVSDLNTSYPINPVQSALCGFGRVVMNEYPSLHCMLLDLACDLSSSEMLLRIENELLRPDGSNEIILTSDARYIMTIREDEENKASHKSQTDRFHLDFHAPGQLHNLMWLPQNKPILKNDEIEVHVQATGLNFRDVMYLMGLLPDEALENGFAGASLGLEFAGQVVNVGSGVQNIHLGDRVMGFGASCFASHIVTRADAVAKMPETWSYASAATVPTVFFTVYYALKHLADVQANETVLIHGGAGGVGIAAIQLAKYLGAEVFATAGSEDKRAFVELLGANRVFDSRSLSFAEDILVATEGKGVDVVLNSLAGEAIRRNLAILKPFGRFLELGKRDFFENTPIGLRPFRNNISYFGIDADQILTARPQLAARLFTEVMELFYNGLLSPLPCRIFNADRIVDAFRFMQQSRHIGKVVVSYEHANPKVESHMPVKEQPVFSPTSTWLVTGGISGFGLESARWLVSCGVKHLVLVSRSGVKAPHAQDIFDEFQAQGIKLEIVSCDIANADAVCAMMTQIQTTMPPLQGLIHAAALYEDTLLHNLDAKKIDKVMQPKFVGAWNLHQATHNLSLEYFILYSSVTVSIGNPGQANYVAANAALEGLARMRRQQGLSATCISWGPIGDAGYLTRNTDVLDSLSERMGKKPIASQQALRELGYCLPNDAIIADFDWSVLSRLLPSSGHGRFRVLNRTLKNSKAVGDETDFRTLIMGKSAEEVSLIVRHYVTNEVAQILAINAERIEPLRSLHDMGLDSLMAVELALGLEQRIGVQLPVMMLNDSPTVEKVTGIIVQKVLMATDNEGTTSNTTHTMIEAIAKQHGDLVSNEALEKIADETHKILKRFPEGS